MLHCDFRRAIVSVLALLLAPLAFPGALRAQDFIRELQRQAIEGDVSLLGHWGPVPEQYTYWRSHSNRLIPVYAFGTKGGGDGIDLECYTGARSVYRNAKALQRIYGSLPTNTVNPTAEYMDQTNLAAIQRAAIAAGRKYVFLVVFDGMDWQTTFAAATYNNRQIAYREGRGTGLHFLDYTAGGTTQYGWMVTAPINEGTKTDVDKQTLKDSGTPIPGGYRVEKGGPNPWTPGNDPFYPITKVAAGKSDAVGEHAYADSASTATAMCSGEKTYNDAINVDRTGGQVATVAHEAQQKGLKVGVVTSVPISHATPASAYAHNVHRDDYQDLTRDLLGLRSIAHPTEALPGVDVLIGGGWGDENLRSDSSEGKAQGTNFVPGNLWITPADLQSVDVEHGGKYVVAIREAGVDGARRLFAASQQAVDSGRRLFGFYGNDKARGHLPFQTADGNYNPTIGQKKVAERYTPADLLENPTLAEMTSAALIVLEQSPSGFWLMVEAGDVDWANHDDNIDNSIGAVNSGDRAVKVITDWVEKHSNWKESLLIVTADHGHYLVLDRPELLTGTP